MVHNCHHRSASWIYNILCILVLVQSHSTYFTFGCVSVCGLLVVLHPLWIECHSMIKLKPSRTAARPQRYHNRSTVTLVSVYSTYYVLNFSTLNDNILAKKSIKIFSPITFPPSFPSDRPGVLELDLIPMVYLTSFRNDFVFI